MRPATRCFHHIVMIHQQDGIFGLLPLPAKQKAAIKILVSTDCEQDGKHRAQQIVKRIKYAFVCSFVETVRARISVERRFA